MLRGEETYVPTSQTNMHCSDKIYLEQISLASKSPLTFPCHLHIERRMMLFPGIVDKR